MEAEFVELVEAAKEAKSLRFLRAELLNPQYAPTIIYEDNQAVIKTLENEVYNDRNKHFSIRTHFLRDEYNNKSIKPVYIDTTKQLADTLTKALGDELFPRHRAAMGITEKPEDISQKNRNQG
jgi:hypothetical protein